MTTHADPAAILASLDFAIGCQSVLGPCRHTADVGARFQCGHVRPMCRSHAERLRAACDHAPQTRQRVFRYCPDCPPYPRTPIRVASIDPLTTA
jgi:hypothetical protein